ncbi:hypothetical protein HDV05_006781, partial [Chytridiales sp. JEL 0842]
STTSPSMPAKKISGSVTFTGLPGPAANSTSHASSASHLPHSSSSGATSSSSLDQDYNNYQSNQQQQFQQQSGYFLNSQHQGSPTAPSVGAVDGREFFKKARSTLSYDEFTTLLANVKA